MARIRTIKPEFPQSESIGRMSRDARLLFIQMWTLADDVGRLRAPSRMLASLLFPYDEDAPSLIDGWIAELEREKCIRRYVVDGTSYAEITNWLNHQKIDKPSASKMPAFDEASRSLAKPRERSSEDQGSRTKDQGSRKGSRIKEGIIGANAPTCSPRDELLTVLDAERAEAVVDHRQKLKKPLTAHAAKLLAAKFAACPDPNAAADTMIGNGWQGFDPKWLDENVTAKTKAYDVNNDPVYKGLL